MPRQPKQQRAIITVEAIVEAALIAAIQQGAENVTTPRIAEIAGIGVGSLYEYFANKEAIFEALHTRMIGRLLGAMQPVLPDVVRLPPREALHQLINPIAQLLHDEPRYLSYLQQPEAFMRFSSETVKHLTPAISEMGLHYISQNPTFLALPNLPAMLFIATNGVSFAILRHIAMPHPTFPLSTLIDAVADLILGVLDRNTPAPSAV